MELEKQCVSLNLAKRLKELGVPQESYFAWYCEGHHFVNEKDGPLEVPERNYEISKDVGSDVDFPYKRIASAYTVTELGALLKQAGAEATIKAYGDLHGFPGTGNIGAIGMLWLLTEPDRVAKMLVYLLENKLIEIN